MCVKNIPQLFYILFWAACNEVLLSCTHSSSFWFIERCLTVVNVFKSKNDFSTFEHTVRLIRHNMPKSLFGSHNTSICLWIYDANDTLLVQWSLFPIWKKHRQTPSFDENKQYPNSTRGPIIDLKVFWMHKKKCISRAIFRLCWEHKKIYISSKL